MTQDPVRLEFHGWWSIGNRDRVPFDELRLWFGDGDRIAGHGMDSIGAFTFDGRQNGVHVEILQKYIKGPTRILTGEVDGEGGIFGSIESRDGDGKWFIRSLADPSLRRDNKVLRLVPLPEGVAKYLAQNKPNGETDG